MEACTPHSALHVAFHGTNGTGGRLGAANVQERYRNITLNNSPARKDQPEPYRFFDVYVTTFARQFAEGDGTIKSLYLWSEEPGTGKTASAVALLNAYLLTHFVGSIQRGLQPEQRPAYFLDAHQLQTDYNMFNRPRVPDSIAEPASVRYYNAIQHAKHTEFVVIDDLATRSTSEAFVADLHSVVNARVTSGKPTVYTSNVPVEKLPLIFGERRLADRIGDKKLCQTVFFEGESKRGERD
ncbi:ATP-binding protein [Virgibacillus proomii]|nr:ATP-binding protein [Virgibacillus proomii]